VQLEFDFVRPEERRTWRKTRNGGGSDHTNKPVQLSAAARQRAAEALRSELIRRTGLRVALTVTNNHSRMLSFKHDEAKSLVRVRLHHMFLSAGPEVIKALAHWINHPRSKKMGALIDQFIRENHDQILTPRKRKLQLEARGIFFDLAALSDELNRQYFNGTVTAKITWGPMSGGYRRRRRSIRYGSYNDEENLIRIHPLLDQEFVPRYFVRYIVFHEMLHAYLGTSNSTTPTGRRRLHSREFKRLEEVYQDYTRAVAWQEKDTNLRRLLSGRGTSALERLSG